MSENPESARESYEAQMRAESERREQEGNLRVIQRLYESRETARGNFWGPADWLRYAEERGLDVSYLLDSKNQGIINNLPVTPDLLMSKSPFNPDKLILEDHELFLGIDKIGDEPFNTLEWQKLENEAMYFKQDPWYQNEDFAKQALSFKWNLMPLQILPKSENKTFAEQEAMLPADYATPNPIEEITKNLLYYLKNIAHFTNKKEKEAALKELNYDKWGRTNTLDLDGLRVDVGYSQPDGLDVALHWGDPRLSDVGLALSRKLQK